MKYIVSWIVVVYAFNTYYKDNVTLTFYSKEAAERLYKIEQNTYYSPRFYIDSLKIDSITTDTSTKGYIKLY